MKEKQVKKQKNSFHLRIYDAELLKSLTELFETGRYDSMNELLNCALAVGVEKIYFEFGKRKLLTKALEIPELPDTKKLDNIDGKVEKLRIMQEDLFVLMNSIEALACSIFNVQRAEINGDTISTELIDSGYLSKLPQYYQDIKDNLVKRLDRKLSKEQDNK